jgi:predicted phage terminase large subunit-like protein
VRYSYWPYKEPIEQLLKMEAGGGTDEKGNRISRYVFAGQYQQNPTVLGGNIIHGEHFRRYTVLPWIKYRKIFGDTAQKTKESNDWSVFEEWGLGVDGYLYLLDLIRGRWEAPELQRRAVAFWAKGKARDIESFGQLRKMAIEDKSSGTGLIQTLRLPPYNIPIQPIERDKDKFTRCLDALPYIECGQVCIPADAPYTSDFLLEADSFTADDTHDFDDQLDPMFDAIQDMQAAGNKLKIWSELGKQGEKTVEAKKAARTVSVGETGGVPVQESSPAAEVAGNGHAEAAAAETTGSPEANPRPGNGRVPRTGQSVQGRSPYSGGRWLRQFRQQNRLTER